MLSAQLHCSYGKIKPAMPGVHLYRPIYAMGIEHVVSIAASADSPQWWPIFSSCFHLVSRDLEV